eukprot:XP_008766645.1 PREDICTED: CMRF35-like molecule 5 isoform X3 [Rattus norvegicus]
MWHLHIATGGCSTAQDPVTGPEEVSSQEQGSLIVQCQYASHWKDYRKYWCRGAEWSSCKILVETDASECLVKENRVSIRDDQRNFIFTVTMEDLRMSDAGIYWCGIVKSGYDPMFKVRVGIEPGCSTAQDLLTGPKEVSSQEQGSLTVRCQYGSWWKDYRKYWCRGAEWSSCKILVETDASECLVKKNRVSMRDNQTNFIFTVTMEDLRMSDAGIYWCGITKAGYDPMFKVHVSIDPGSSPWCCTIPEPTTSSPVDPQPSMTTIDTIPAPSPQPRSLLSSPYFCILLFLELPLFLCMLCAILWVNRPQTWSGRQGIWPYHESQ